MRGDLFVACQVIGFLRKVDIRLRVVIGIRHWPRRRTIVNRFLIGQFIYPKYRGALSRHGARPDPEGKYRKIDFGEAH